jgi:hypothetical protein
MYAVMGYLDYEDEYVKVLISMVLRQLTFLFTLFFCLLFRPRGDWPTLYGINITQMLENVP